MIEVRDLVVRYDEVDAVRGVDLVARDDRVLGVVGPNGSGKTTVLRAILGAVRPDAGAVTVDGQPLTSLSARDRARRIAAVVQEEPSGLPMTAWDTVLLGRSPLLSGWSGYRTTDEQVAEASMRQTGVWHLADRLLEELSGGERQRVLIARALTQGAGNLLLDEPTNHLDVRYQHELLSLVAGLDRCSVVVLHDLNLAARYCDDVVVLDRGTVVTAGDPHEVLEPEVLASVYGIGTRRVVVEGVPQLLFTPRAGAGPQRPVPADAPVAADVPVAGDVPVVADVPVVSTSGVPDAQATQQRR